MVRSVLLAGIVLLALTSCGSGGPAVAVAHPGEMRAPDPRSPPVVTPGDEAALSAGNSAFAGRLLGLLARAESGVALSPLSISDALAMTFPGAQGKTASQIATALDFRLTPPRLAAAFNALAQSLGTINRPGVSLSIANALYGQRGMLFRPAFLSLLARDYGAGMRIVDFANAADQARAAINAWVSQRTHEKIPSLLHPGDIDALTRLVLVNAVYLHAMWQSPFYKSMTSPAPFQAPGGTVQVPTMNQNGMFPYARRAGYQALELPYRGGRLAFDVLLPDPGRLPSLLDRISTRGPLDLLQGLRQSPIELSLPKLLLRTRFELPPTLEALGMRSAFDPARADLSGIAGRPGDLYIKTVVHEAYLHVDEAGTEAAAATAVVSEGVSAIGGTVVFDVDRPFVFVLRDRKTGAILFLGTVYHP